MTPAEIENLFTRADGTYAFARWGRPLAPVVFGVDDATLGVVKSAIEAVCTLSGHETMDADAELGANFMWFFFSEWDELMEVPNLDRLVPDLGPLVVRLKSVEANQYRIFRFDQAGAIQACFVFVCLDTHMAEATAQTVALSQAVQSMVMWSDLAFQDRSPLVVAGEGVAVRPEIGMLLRAAYDPVMPGAAQDASHALRLAARLGAPQ